MAERRGHPVGGWVVGVHTVVSVVGVGVASALFVPAACSLDGKTCGLSA